MQSSVLGSDGSGDCCIATSNATQSRSALSIGYMRRDPTSLPMERQIECMDKYRVTQWFTDTCSGTSVLKDQLRYALNSLEAGSVFYVPRLEVLSWRLDEVLAVIDRVAQKEASFVSVSEGIDSRQSLSLNAFARAVQRYEADVRAARNYDPYTEILDRVTAGEIKATEAARILKVSKATISRRLNGLIGDYESANV